ncbi:putative Rieske 2Fe-2S iron-sulfur protein YhfW [Daldinia childiae]|uniref:putative Rieske 2Fe-2S iron-sulfur protein YhfW n=1 Tax=Daldinia childiae TaxID=326645 RepID=UPI0014476055|nr:putative Rieske 2Fe-2S iron-sulfur protein YhfW [Daldinia childiae]KAF3064952.1 putative Rieske 2Fe-2S iron-sulfur protein YhfW [Daldinia childiae]
MAKLVTNDLEQFVRTSGITNPVWIHGDPFSKRPQFNPLSKDIETDVCIIGAGIAGISIAYELITRGREVVLVEARDVLSGETGRTSGHLSNALDDMYPEIAKKHGKDGAKAAAESHTWALNRVGEIAKELGIDCEYRHLPGYRVSQYQKGTEEHKKDMDTIKEDVEMAKKLGIDATFDENLTVRGWGGKPDQRGGAIFANQAAFHPTKYLNGVLKWLKEQPKFQCYTSTRVLSVKEKGIEMLGLGHKYVQIETEADNTISCEHAIEATDVPLQKLSVIVQMEWDRTYCIALRVPKGSIDDILLYDTDDPYKYIRLTPCDENDDYMIVGGEDHKVGQEDSRGHFEALEKWARERFPQAKSVEYQWSGQIFEPVDYMAYIGKNQGNNRIYVVTGDSGNGLTHGVLASKLIADEIEDTPNTWSSLYSPKRVSSVIKSAPTMIQNDLQANMQYKRLLQSDIQDIEDLKPGCGGVLNPTASKPIAVYKDENGNITKMSALCPHMGGVVCWNSVEKSWDCPVHGSRFGEKGLSIQGPAKANLGKA